MMMRSRIHVLLLLHVVTIPASTTDLIQEYAVTSALFTPRSLLEPFPIDLPPNLLAIIAQQYVQDMTHGELAPLLHLENREKVGDVSLSLRRQIQKIDEKSISFTSEEDYRIVLTYSGNQVVGPHSLHPAVKNLLFTKIAPRDTAAVISFLSPPVALMDTCPPGNRKTAFFVPGSHLDEAIHVRLSIRERFGLIMTEVRSIKSLFAGTADAILKLQRLHALGIFHGDIAPHSILIRDFAPWQVSAKFIHFDHAGFINDSFPGQASRSRGFNMYRETGLRDDLFKLVIAPAVAFMRIDDEDEIFEHSSWARREFVFASLVDSLRVSSSAKRLIRVKLETVLHIVRNLEDEDSAPYSEIADELHAVAALADSENHMYWSLGMMDFLPHHETISAETIPSFLPALMTDPSRKFEYEYNPRLLRGVDPEMTDFLATVQETEQRLDNALAIPRLLHDDEQFYIPGESNRVRIVLAEALANSGLSSVFALSSHPNWVVKYQSNCERKDEIHPLLADYFFLSSKLKGLDVVPQVHFLSPAAYLDFPLSPKTSFIARDKLFHPNQRMDVHVRFMVMERAKLTFDALQRSYRDKLMPIRDALATMIRSVDALEKIHSRGVIHCDVHAGNFVILNNNNVGLIDFGRSKIAAFHLEGDARIAEPFSNYHIQYSPFEINGYKSSYRDDLYRALEIGVGLLIGPAIYAHMDLLVQQSPEALYRFKAEGDFFAIESVADRIETDPALTENKKTVIRTALKAAMTMVRGVKNVYDYPPYRKIAKALRMAFDSANN